MKKYTLVALVALVALTWADLEPKHATAQNVSFQTEEYLTICWDGRDNTHVIRPNGKVESLGAVLSKAARPPRTDERAYYLNVAMNAVAMEGYEFAGKSENEIVMKRRIQKKQ